MKSVLQDWVQMLPLRQQTILLSSLRGPDGVAKEHPAKPLLRFFRRSILISAFDGEAIHDPFDPRGGNYTGPSGDFTPSEMVDNYLKNIDSLPFHFIDHFMQSINIIGQSHSNVGVKTFWSSVHFLLCRKLHVTPNYHSPSDDKKDWLESKTTKNKLLQDLNKIWGNQ